MPPITKYLVILLLSAILPAVRVKFATPYIGDQPMPDPKNKTFVGYESLVDMVKIKSPRKLI